MNEIDVIENAIQKIQQGWHKTVSYRDANGTPCSRSEAASYCLFGALEAATLEIFETYFDSPWSKVVNLINPRVGGCTRWATWNDAEGRTKEDVLRLLDGALQDAKGES